MGWSPPSACCGSASAAVRSILVLLALLAARRIARGVLAPVEAAAQAAERIERGDFSARVPVTSSDEFGSWAERFNRMAAALEDSIGRLQEAQSQNRRFVADVSHELRTPLAALVAEASILREDVGSLPERSRRAGELLVADIARLRVLVDDLMEVSRFDADAEQVSLQPVDVGRLLETVTASRLPDAPNRPAVGADHTRDGSATARADRRQPPRQRPRARPRIAGRARAWRPTEPRSGSP